MRVGLFFFGCMMMGAVAGIAYATRNVVEAWSSQNDAITASRELVAFREIFRIPEMVSAERVVSVGQMSAPDAAGEPEKQAMATTRRNTDVAFETAMAAVTQGEKADERRNSIAATAVLIRGMRQDIDRISALPRSSRPADALSAPLLPAQQVYQDITRLLSSIENGEILQDSVIQDDLDLARLAYSFRQWASQRGTALIGAIASGQPMTSMMTEDLAMSVGHLAEIWAQIKNYQETRSLGPEILAAIATVQSRYFGDTGKLYDRVLAAGRSGAAYPNLADFRRDHIAGVVSPFLIRDSAIAHAIDRASYLTAASRRSLRLAATLLVIVCAVIAGATWLFTRRVVTALTALTATITELAARDHTVSVPYQNRHDEMGRMAQAIEILRCNDVAFNALTERAAQEQAINQQRAEQIGQLCQDFHEETRTTIEAALQSALLMRDGAQTSSSLVAEVEKRTLSVVTTTRHASGNVQAIVDSAEHLTSSINALAEQVRISASIASRAESAVDETATRMRDLTNAAEKIGAVTSLIQKIAGQTNLLALNATIEAARAGSAGKGFAIVAGEVKALANQTARATDDIAAQVALVQAATGGVGDMIGKIFQTITDINRVGHDVGEAVEGQKQATADIAVYVHEAAGGINAVAANINEVQGATGRTGAAAAEMTQSVARLTHDAEHLTQQISTFLSRVRAA